MDFHGLKRKKLQQLCKKHGIPANLKNVELADRLSALFKEEKSMKRGRSCLKDLSVINDEEVTDSKDAKRVKFSPQNETFVFEKTDPREMRLLARKRRDFPKSKDEDDSDSVIGDTVQSVDILEKEKPITKNLRRRSIVVKSDQISDSRIGDNGAKPLARNLRRKSAVVKPDQMPEKKRMMSATSKMQEVKGEANDGDNKISEIEGLKRRSSRKTMINGGPKAMEVVSRVERRLSEEKRMMPATSKMQEVKGEANDGDNKISESEGLKRRSSRKTMINGGPKAMEVVRRSSRVERRMSKVEQQVVDDDEVHPSMNHLEMAADCVNEQEAIGYSIETPATVRDEGTVIVDSAPPQSLSDCRGYIVEEQCHPFEYSISAEKKADNSEEATEVSPYSTEKMNVLNNIIPLEGCREETEIIDKTGENVPAAVQTPINENSMFQNNGDVEAESTMVADEIEESFPSLNILADGNSYEEIATTPPSIVKRQLCDTALGSIADQTCGAAESLCHSTMKPSLPGSKAVTDVGGQQPSNCLDEFKGEMRNSEVLEISEGLECYDQSKNEQSIQRESWVEGSPCLNGSPQIDVRGEDKLINCDVVIVEESDVQSAVEGEAAGLWVSCDSIFREVEQTTHAFSADQQSSLLNSQENVVLGPDTSVKANVQSPIDTEGLTPSSNTSAATINKFMEGGKHINKVTSLWNRGIDSSENNAEDIHLVQSLNKDDSEDRAEPSSTISTFSLYLQSQVKGSIEKGVESCKETSDIAYVESSIQVNNTAEEGTCKIDKQLDEVNVKLEFAKADMNNFNERGELQSEKIDSVAKQDAFDSSIEGETPVLSKERKWSQVNICQDIFGSTDNKTFERVSGSNRAKYLEQCSMGAAEALKGNVSSSKNNSANFEDRELPEASHSANALSCLDVGSTCIEFFEHNLAVDTDTDADKLESHLNDDNRSADWKSMPEKDNHPQLENLSDCYTAQNCELSALSVSITEEGHKETSNYDLTCFVNDGNVENVDEDDKYTTAIEQEEVSCFDEPEFQNLVFGNDKDDSIHSKDLESKIFSWTTEDLLALGGEVEESVLFQKRKPADLAYEGSTLQYDVHCNKIVSDPTKDLECVAVKEDGDDDANINGDSNVINLQFQNGEPAEASNLENATSSGEFKDSAEKEVDTMAQETGYAQEEGMGIWGNESPGSTIRIDLDQAAGQVFTQQRSIERATGEDAESAEKDSKINSEREFGEAEESELAMQSSFLIAVPETGKNDGENETLEVCSTLANDPGHSVGQGKDSDSFEMTAICGSPRRNSGKFSLADEASVLNTDAESVVVFCPSSMDQKSTCYSATFEIASDYLHTLLDNKSNETLQNACIGYIEGVHPGKAILFKDDQDNEVKSDDMMELDGDKSDVLPSESAMPDNIKSQALVHEMDDGPENIAGENLVESAGTKEMELQVLTSGTFSIVNWKLDSAKGNYEVDTDTAEARSNIDSAMMESCFFGEYEKGLNGIKTASKSVPEVQTDNHLNAANRTRQENVNEEQEGDADTNGNDDSASSRSEDLLPFDFDEVSDVNTIIANKKSINAEAEVECNVDEGNCIFGEPVIHQDHMDVNMDSIDKDACMAEEDHLALERPENLESSPCANYFMDSAPKHIVQSESKSPDGKDNVTHTRRASTSPICENNGVIFDPSEDKVRDGSVEDIVALSKPMEEHDELAAEDFFKPSSTIDREGNDSDSVDYLLPCVSENVTDQLQEQNHNPLMPSYQQIDPTESACQTDKAANEDMKSDFVFTDSEIELFWGAATKDALQTAAAEFIGYVNVNEIVNVAGTVSSHEAAVEKILEPEEAAEFIGYVNANEIQNVAGTVSTHKAAFKKILEPEDSAPREREQLGHNKKQELGVGEVQDCIDDKGNGDTSGYFCANNSGRVVEKGKDLGTDDKVLMPSVIQRKNARSVLIHGTPKRQPVLMHDMKENTPARKRLQTVDATALKPSLRRRKALEDIGK